MPKENTHIYFASELLRDIPDAKLRHILESYRKYFFLGAIFPDTMYYSRREDIADTLHGKSGNLTNEPILDMLEKAEDERDFAFCCGYISHCALDITFHPMVYYLSGDYYDPDPVRREHAAYLHRHIETCLDVFIKNPLRMHELLQCSLMEGLAFEKIVSRGFSVGIREIRRALQTQLRMNRLFTSRAGYVIFSFLCRLGLIHDWTLKGLFYANIKHEAGIDFSILNYQDILTGEGRQSTLQKLFEQATSRAITMLTRAYAYSRRVISREELIHAIPGESLNTGTLHTPVTAIKYTNPHARGGHNER
jgi:hypothetical protein